MRVWGGAKETGFMVKAGLFILPAFAAGGAQAFALGKGLAAEGAIGVDVARGFERGDGFQELGFCGGVVCHRLAVAALVLFHEQGVEQAQTDELTLLRGGQGVRQQLAAFFYAAGQGGIILEFDGGEGAEEEDVRRKTVLLGIFPAAGGVFVGASLLQSLRGEGAQGEGGKGALLICQDEGGQGGDGAFHGAGLGAGLLCRFAFGGQGDVFAGGLRGIGEVFLHRLADVVGIHPLGHEDKAVLCRMKGQGEQEDAGEELLHSTRLMVMRLKRDSEASDSVAMPGILASSLCTRRRW